MSNGLPKQPIVFLIYTVRDLTEGLLNSNTNGHADHVAQKSFPVLE
jgi:hypothetical protein